MITVCGKIIQNKILQRIREAQFHSVIADEATDSANDKQLSISIRFVENGTPNEKFLGSHECRSGVSGEASAGNILEQLTEWQLEPQLLRGQAFAGAMAGRSKSTAAHITSQYPKAVYTHCAAHRLSRCVVKCCSAWEVSNMMQTADAVARFFSNSPKGQLALETWIDDIFQDKKTTKS